MYYSTQCYSLQHHRLQISRIAKDLRLPSGRKYHPNKDFFPLTDVSVVGKLLDIFVSSQVRFYTLSHFTGDSRGLWDWAAAGNEPLPVGLFWNVFSCQLLQGCPQSRESMALCSQSRGQRWGKEFESLAHHLGLGWSMAHFYSNPLLFQEDKQSLSLQKGKG